MQQPHDGLSAAPRNIPSQRPKLSSTLSSENEFNLPAVKNVNISLLDSKENQSKKIMPVALKVLGRFGLFLRF